MNEDELDLLASSYLDGEATPDEVARVERDPRLMARVEELRVTQAAIRGPVAVPSGLKEQQLAAAMAAFDDAKTIADRRAGLTVVPEQAEPPTAAAQAEPVIDLRERWRRKEEAAGRMRWLSAVAGVLVFAAGGVFLISQINGADDGDFATGSLSDEAATETAESGAEAEMAELSPAADGDDGTATATSAAAAAAEAVDSEAAAADAEEDFAVDEAADASMADEAPPVESPIVREGLPDAGFFADEPVVRYLNVPTGDEILDQIDLPWRSTDSSQCAGRAEVPDGAEVIAYLPIEVTRPDGTTEVVEALYITIDNRTEVLLVSPETCRRF